MLAALVTLASFHFSPQPVHAHPHPHFKHVCASTKKAHIAHCNAIIIDAAEPQANVPSGLNPADLQAAYHLPSNSSGYGQTIAIIEAYDDPNAEADLAVYRAQFGLPDCTTANGCFRKVDQNGGTIYPQPDTTWAQEASIDLDTASATCPNCHLMLVEATSASSQNLGEAVNTAVRLGAHIISNSYGESEVAAETSYAADYNHPGVVMVASAGDAGYGVEYPAAFNTVIAVGGTTLKRSATNARGWKETTWSGTSSGCSAYISKPSWQVDSSCNKRMVVDVAAVADPTTGVSVYDTYAKVGGWHVFGGTSVAAPIIAAAYALAGNAESINAPATLYSHPGDLFDITRGSVGTCSVSYFCNAGPGYDGPSGLGTPNGIGAF